MKHRWQLRLAYTLLLACAPLAVCCRLTGTLGALPDVGADASADVATVDGHDDLAAGDSTVDGSRCFGAPFSPPVELAEVSSANNDEWSPFITADGLQLVFTSWRDGGSGQADIWHASRSAVGAPFDPPTPVEGINTSGREGSACLTSGGSRLYFSSNRPGGAGDVDLWVAERAGGSGPFVSVQNLGAINSAAWEEGCAIGDGGLSLYFTSYRPGGVGRCDIYRATRASTADAFAAPELVPVVNSADEERIPVLSADGRELFFSSDRAGGKGGHDIWMASRDDPTAAFSEPVPVAVLNSDNDELTGSLAADGSALYYIYNADLEGGGSQRANIWVAYRDCP